MPSYGLVMEGPYDTPVFKELTRRLDGPDFKCFTFECEGRANLKRKFPGYLKALEHWDAGGPVDKVLVICDCDNDSVAQVEAELSACVNLPFSFPFGIEFCAIKRETETWLLADHEAICAIAEKMSGRPVPEILGDLEAIVDPKEKLRKVLASARLPYTPGVLGAIAAAADLDKLRYRLPSFRNFEPKV